jgi:hypothetical protein
LRPSNEVRRLTLSTLSGVSSSLGAAEARTTTRARVRRCRQRVAWARGAREDVEATACDMARR